jgi:phosphopentomutase
MKKPPVRIFLIVLDSVGIGELPDAKRYGDQGANTLVNISKKIKNFNLPTLQKLGLGNIRPSRTIPFCKNPIGNFGYMAEKSAGKDTTTGHWELCGILTKKPFPTYPRGFPPEVTGPFKRKIGRDILANRPASGTEIIDELGAEHMRTGFPIVYTSADSVFQIACHEDIIPVPQLYRMCGAARRLLKGRHNVCRVIARPFIGKPGRFTRTERRRDFALAPKGMTLPDLVVKRKGTVLGIGKIHDIFSGRGITETVHTKSNADAIDEILKAVKRRNYTLTFANLVDFDTLYGHRNDTAGYYKALKYFDGKLKELLHHLKKNDILIITADHGCDPTHPSTDHTREHVPILIYGKSLKHGIHIGRRASFADCGQTVADILGIGKTRAGASFKKMILETGAGTAT